MILRMDPIGYVIAITFGWMLLQFCQAPDEPPEPIRIVAPALHTSAAED